MEDNLDIKSKILNSFAWVFSSNSIQYFLQFILLIIYARLLSPKEFGIVNIVLIIVGLSELFSQFGIGSSIIFFKVLKKRTISTAFNLSFLFGLFFFLLVFNLSGKISIFFNEPTLPILLKVSSICFIFSGISVVPDALLQRQKNFKKLSIINIISYLFGYAFIGLLLAINSYGEWALIIAYVSQVAIKTVILLVKSKISYNLTINKQDVKGIIAYGNAITLGNSGNYIATNADNFIVGKFLSVTALGFYGKAYQLMMVPVKIFGQVIERILFPYLSEMNADYEKLRVVFLFLTKIIAIAILPLSIFLAFYGKTIVGLLLGSQWDSVSLPFSILVSALVFRTLYKISESLLKATGHVYRRAWAQWVYALLVVLFTVISIKFGIVGVAAGVLLAIISNFFLMLLISIKVLEIKFIEYIKAFISAFFISLFVIGISFFLQRVDLFSDILNMLFSGFLVAVFISYELKNKYLKFKL